MKKFDIELDASGMMPLYPRLVTGRWKVQQAMIIALRTHLGEWLPDQTRGLPFKTWIDELWANLQAVGGVIRQEILAVDGVEVVTRFDITRANGTISVDANVRLEGEDTEFGVVVENLEGPEGNMVPLVWMHFDGRRFGG